MAACVALRDRKRVEPQLVLTAIVPHLHLVIYKSGTYLLFTTFDAPNGILLLPICRRRLHVIFSHDESLKFDRSLVVQAYDPYRAVFQARLVLKDRFDVDAAIENGEADVVVELPLNPQGAFLDDLIDCATSDCMRNHRLMNETNGYVRQISVQPVERDRLPLDVSCDRAQFDQDFAVCVEGGLMRRLPHKTLSFPPAAFGSS